MTSVVQEGEFLFSPRAAERLGVDLLTILNEIPKRKQTEVRRILDQVLLADGLEGEVRRDGEAALRQIMNRSEYSNPYHKERPKAYAQVRRGFLLAYPNEPFRSEDGGLISDGNPLLTVEDLPLELGEGAYVLSRQAVQRLGEAR